MGHEMTNFQLIKVLKKCPPFDGVYASDQLKNRRRRTKRPVGIVVNTQPAGTPGEHWVAMYWSSSTGQGEYFDSYGLPPPPLFARYMTQESGGKEKWIWNRSQLQEPWTTACGHFCAFYLLLRFHGHSMQAIVQYLEKISHNDKYVMKFVQSLL